MDPDIKKCCDNCEYACMSEEYWHDHYLIQPVMYCSYHSRYNEYRIKPDDVCDCFLPRK